MKQLFMILALAMVAVAATQPHDHNPLDQGGEVCAIATLVGPLPYCDDGSTDPAADNYAGSCGGAGSPDVVYRYNPPDDTIITVSLCVSGYNTVLHIWDECPDAGGTQICCNDDIVFCPAQSCCAGIQVLGGHSYYMIVDGLGGDFGTYQFEVGWGTLICSDHFCPPEVPPPDVCEENAFQDEVPFWRDGITIGANLDDAPDCFVPISAPGLWVTTVGTGNLMTAATCNAQTDFNTRITVYCGSCAGLICVTGNDDFCQDRSRAVWCSQAGAVYRILIHGAGQSVGHFRVEVLDNGQLCSGAIPCPPPNPDSLVIQRSGPHIMLFWESSPGASFYAIYRATTPNVPIQPSFQIGTSTTTVFTDAGVINSPTPLYFYAVTAVRN